MIGRAGKPRYGAGGSQFTGPMRLPSASALVRQAFADADNWWAAQGSRPQPLDLHTDPTNNEDGAYAKYNSGYVNVDPQTIQRWQGYLTNSNRQGKLATLAMMWGMAGHERGHDLGYQHGASPLMKEGIGPLPGEAYAWARRVLGPRRPPRR